MLAMTATEVRSSLTCGIPRTSSTLPTRPRQAFTSPCAVKYKVMQHMGSTCVATSHMSRLPNWAMLSQTAWRLGSSEPGVNLRISAVLSTTCSTQACALLSVHVQGYYVEGSHPDAAHCPRHDRHQRWACSPPSKHAEQAGGGHAMKRHPVAEQESTSPRCSHAWPPGGGA